MKSLVNQVIDVQVSAPTALVTPRGPQLSTPARYLEGVGPFFRNRNNPPILAPVIQLFCTAKYEEAHRAVNEIIPIARGDERLSAYNWLSKIARAKDQNEFAISTHLTAEPLVSITKNRSIRGGHYIGFGLSKLRQGDEYSAERLFEQAAQCFMDAGDYSNFAMADNNLNCLLIEQGRADEAIPNLEYARGILESVEMVQQLAIVDDTLALAYLSLKQYLTALNYSHQSVQAGGPKETMRKILDEMEG